eukprot:scaffold28686_cov18-Tisochrysis_lutea.AAC.2
MQVQQRTRHWLNLSERCCGVPRRQVQVLCAEKQERIEATKAELLRMGAAGTLGNGKERLRLGGAAGSLGNGEKLRTDGFTGSHREEVRSQNT